MVESVIIGSLEFEVKGKRVIKLRVSNNARKEEVSLSDAIKILADHGLNVTSIAVRPPDSNTAVPNPPYRFKPGEWTTTQAGPSITLPYSILDQQE